MSGNKLLKKGGLHRAFLRLGHEEARFELFFLIFFSIKKMKQTKLPNLLEREREEALEYYLSQLAALFRT